MDTKSLMWGLILTGITLLAGFDLKPTKEIGDDRPYQITTR